MSPYQPKRNSYGCTIKRDRVDMVVELRVQYCRYFFRINLRPTRLFYGVKLFSKSENNFSP